MHLVYHLLTWCSFARCVSFSCFSIQYSAAIQLIICISLPMSQYILYCVSCRFIPLHNAPGAQVAPPSLMISWILCPHFLVPIGLSLVEYHSFYSTLTHELRHHTCDYSPVPRHKELHHSFYPHLVWPQRTGALRPPAFSLTNARSTTVRSFCRESK